jgi:hypothetical protein
VARSPGKPSPHHTSCSCMHENASDPNLAAFLRLGVRLCLHTLWPARKDATKFAEWSFHTRACLKVDVGVVLARVRATVVVNVDQKCIKNMHACIARVRLAPHPCRSMSCWASPCVLGHAIWTPIEKSQSRPFEGRSALSQTPLPTLRSAPPNRPRCASCRRSSSLQTLSITALRTRHHCHFSCSLTHTPALPT